MSPINARLHPAVLLLIIALFLLLVLPTVGRQGIGWDEQIDLEIARVYASSFEGLIHGSSIDAINTRLPTYSIGLLFRAAGTVDRDLARFVGCAVSVLTLLAVVAFCWRELDPVKGLVACGLLATSPYFLSFSPTAFTEGDVFITCAVAWVMVGLAWLRRAPSWERAAVAGILLGLAASAKISGVALMPAALIAIAMFRPNPGRPGDVDSARLCSLSVAGLLGIAMLSGAWMIVTAIVSRVGIRMDPATLPSLLTDASSRWFAVVGLWLALLVWAYLNRSRVWSRLGLAILISLVAGLTFFVFPPVHTTNPRILGQLALASTGLRGDAEAVPLFEAAAHHFLVILFKPSLLIGAGLWLGALLAVLHFRSRPELRLPVLVLVCYGGFLLALPWAQTFYMMPLFPVLAILAADALVRLFHAQRSVALGLSVAAVGLLVWDLARCYPDFNLNGYQWLGERQLAGQATLGYRAVAQVRSDGVEQVLRWANDHIGPQEVVVAFVGAPHVIRGISPAPAYRLINGLRKPSSIEDAD